MDGMVKYDIPLNNNMGVSLRLDIFNLFDNDGITEVDEEGDLETGEVNEYFQTPTHYQSPRSVRFGVGFTF